MSPADSGPGRSGASAPVPRGRRGGEHDRELLRRLRWPLGHRLGTHLAGDERSRHLGPGLEFADVREYHPTEDARFIDWNLTARSDRPYVRESHPDRGLDVWLVVDASRSLDWGTTRQLKREAGDELTEMLALLLARHGSRTGAIVFDAEPRRVLGLTSGRAGRLTMLSRLRAETAAGPSGAGPTDLAGALEQARRVVRRPSVLVVISDFLVADGWQRPMKALALRHDVVAARVTDPREREIPMIGVVTFEDPETGRQQVVDTTSKRLRERFRAAAAAQDEAIRAAVREARAQLLEITTAESVLPQLVSFLRARQALRGRVAAGVQ